MNTKTLSRAVAYSLGAHGLVLALIFMANANAVLPRQTIETVPFIRASLVYAMNSQSDQKTASLMHQKVERLPGTADRLMESRFADQPALNKATRKSEPETAVTEVAKLSQTKGTERDALTSLQLPALRNDDIGKHVLHASGGKTLALPRYLNTSRPSYPMIARVRGYEGVVFIFVEVLADGHAGQVRINRSSGHVSLDKSALDAVKGWRFEPAKKSGQAVTLWVEIPVRFSLNDDA
jgi:periplasmic protein TonB